MHKKKEKIKLALICPVDFMGGAEFFVLSLLEEISKNHPFWEIYLFCSNHQTFLQNISSKIKVIKFDFPRLKKFSLFAIKDFFTTAQKLYQKIITISPNIVLSNSIRSHLLTAQALNKTNIKFAFFVHDFTFPGFFLRLFSRQVNKIFTCSNSVKKDLLIKNKTLKNKITTIYGGVNLPQKNINKTKRTFKNIGIIGRLDPWKGQDIFIKSAEIILKKNNNLRFFIFGKSSGYDPATKQFEKKLQNIIKEKKLQKKVFLCGFVEREKALKKIDLLVHASCQKEPFGKVIIESLSYGIPIIASSLGGSREIIKNGYNGFLINPKNPQLLAKKILQIISDQKLRKKFIYNGLATIKEKFLLSKVTKKLLQNLKQM